MCQRVAHRVGSAHIAIESGRIAQEGFTFQRAYAVLKLSELLTQRAGLCAVRYEGAQDVDLAFFDGWQEYVQAKHRPETIYTAAELADSLRNLAEDLLDAGSASKLRFRFLLAGQLDRTLLRVRANTSTPADISLIADIVASVPAAASLGLAERTSLAADLLSRTAVTSLGSIQDTVAPQDLGIDEYSAADLMVAAAGMNLIKVEIPSGKIDDALRRLEGGLNRVRSFDARDIAELLEDLLPDSFPKRGSTIARLPPSDSRPQADTARVAEFWDGGQVDWDVIKAGAVMSREGADQLERSIRDGGADGRVVAVLGSPGAGKTAIAMRIAWQLQSSGHGLVVEIVDPGNEKAWTWLTRFSRSAKGRVIAFADDALRHDVARQALATLDAELPIVVLTTADSGSFNSMRFRREPRHLNLTSLTDAEVIAAARLVGADLSLGEGELARLKSHGDVIALMDRLRGGTGLENRMRAIFHGLLQERAADAVDTFRLVAAATSLDVSVPIVVIDRMQNGGLRAAALRLTATGRLVRTRVGDRLRVGHQVRGKAAVRIMTEGVSRAEAARNFGELLLRLVDAVDVTSPEERRFGIGLVHLAARDERTPLLGLEEGVVRFGSAIIGHAQMAELLRLAGCLVDLSRKAQAETIKAVALTKPLLTGIDAANYRSVMASDGRFSQAIPALLEFYAHPQASFGRRGFLEMMCAPEVSLADRRLAFERIAQGPAKEAMAADELDALLKLAWHIGEDDITLEAVRIAAEAAARFPGHLGLLRRASNLSLRVPTFPATTAVMNAAENALGAMVQQRYPIDRLFVREAGKLIADRADETQATRSFALVRVLVNVHQESPHEALRLFYPWFASGTPTARRLALAFMEERAAAGRASMSELSIMRHRSPGR